MPATLTYSLVYTPDLKSDKVFNPVCSDKKIHIRLRDFDKPQVIRGFERKLTYLAGYLINFSYLNSLFDICDEKTIINALLDSEDMKTIYQSLKYDKQIEFKCFHIKPNYKKSDHAAFGKLCQEALPLEYDAFGAPKEGTLAIFLKKLKLSLLEYLFDDSYSIIIHKKHSGDSDAKYLNKEMRKSNKLLDDFEKLW